MEEAISVVQNLISLPGIKGLERTANINSFLNLNDNTYIHYFTQLKVLQMYQSCLVIHAPRDAANCRIDISHNSHTTTKPVAQFQFKIYSTCLSRHQMFHSMHTPLTFFLLHIA